MNFMPYPFEKLRNLLKDSVPPDLKDFKEDVKTRDSSDKKDSKNAKFIESKALNLSIGEPGFDAPNSVLEAIKENAELVRYYPKALDELVHAQIDFVKKRFGVSLADSEIVPTFGSREVLFNFPHFLFLDVLKKDSKKPVMAFPNPFYQIYEGAQIANNAEVIYMPLTEYNDFKPYLSDENLKDVDLVILNSPNNPTGQALNIDELSEWVKLALKHDFILINDECYSEIYADTPPPSLLEASIKAGNKDFKNIFAINSISKRISAPGLRSGFIAGDSRILKKYKIFRTYVGISMPLTLQMASIVAWQELEYAEFIREKFSKNLALAREIFADSVIFPYTFYLWLKVQDCNEIHLNANRLFNDEVFCKELYESTGHIVLPGSYLGRNEGGIGYVRIALIHEPPAMQKALEEIKAFYIDFKKRYKCGEKR